MPPSTCQVDSFVPKNDHALELILLRQGKATPRVKAVADPGILDQGSPLMISMGCEYLSALFTILHHLGFKPVHDTQGCFLKYC